MWQATECAVQEYTSGYIERQRAVWKRDRLRDARAHNRLANDGICNLRMVPIVWGPATADRIDRIFTHGPYRLGPGKGQLARQLAGWLDALECCHGNARCITRATTNDYFPTPRRKRIVVYVRFPQARGPDALADQAVGSQAHSRAFMACVCLFIAVISSTPAAATTWSMGLAQP